jgi:hypothetical protein
MKLFKESKPDATTIWKHYDKGVDHHTRISLYTDTETYFNMVEGDQWHGVETGEEKLSSHDFLTGIVDHKTAMVAMNNMKIVYSPLNGGDEAEQTIYREVCEKLNKFAESKWNLTDMETADWEIVNDACVAGDSYLFFYNKELDHQKIDRTNIYFADEQNQDIQPQKRIIIYERRFVDDVKEDARNNKVDEKEIESIVPDDDTDTLPEAARQEVENDKKCSCLLQLEKKPMPAPYAYPFGIYIARSTQTVIYQPETHIQGLTLYPIAKMLWYPKRGSSRGVGEVRRRLNNQINANKQLARREQNVKATGFSKPVYNTDMVTNEQDVDKVGLSIKMRGSVQRVSDAFTYVAPSPMSPDAKALQDELIDRSRDLANAGDNATGNINPEQASGAAIIAVKDQQAISTTKPQKHHKKFMKEVAAIYLDTWTAYNPNGLQIEYEEDGQMFTDEIPAEVLQNLKVNIRIDVSPTNPYSKFAREQAIENTLKEGHITFAEYVGALEDDSTAPKAKFEEIIKKREEAAQMQGELAQAQQQTQQKTPSETIAFKDLPPEGKIQMAAHAGIQLSPQDVVQPIPVSQPMQGGDEFALPTM